MKNNFLNRLRPHGLFGDSPEASKQLDLLESQLKTVKDNSFNILCAGCEKEFKIMFLYRCFYCGLWFCPKCAKEHFN